jgi:hypothetical protein
LTFSLQSNPTNNGRVGALPALLNFALERGAEVLELYQAEWLIANDPDRPQYSLFGKIYREALDKAAAKLSS